MRTQNATRVARTQNPPPQINLFMARLMPVVVVLVVLAQGAFSTNASTPRSWAGVASYLPDFNLPWQVQADRTRLQTPEDKLYFIYGSGAPVAAPSIWRSNLDGTKREKFVCTTGCIYPLVQLVFPKLLHVDPEDGYLYWFDSMSQHIARVRMNQSQPATRPEMLVCGPFGVCARRMEGLDVVGGFVVDSKVTKRLYWSGLDSIASVPLTGTGPVTKIVCEGQDCRTKVKLPFPQSLKIDVTAVGGSPFLYWTSFRRVMRMRVGGEELTTLVCHTSQPTPGCVFSRNDVFDPKQLVIDNGGGVSAPSVFWADSGSKRIMRMRIDLTALSVVMCAAGGGCGKNPPGGFNEVLFLHVGLGSTLHWVDSGPASGIDMAAGRLQTSDGNGDNARTLLCGPATTCGSATPKYARWESTGAVTADMMPPLGGNTQGMNVFAGFTLSTSDQSIAHIDMIMPLTPTTLKTAITEPAFSGSVTGFAEGSGGVVWSVGGRIVALEDKLGGGNKTVTKQTTCGSGCAAAAPSLVGRPAGLTFDKASGKMYWVDMLRRAVMRGDAQGGAPTMIACRSDDPTCSKKIEKLQNPIDVQIDRKTKFGPYLYFIDRNPQSRIIRTTLDGSGQPVVLACSWVCGVGGCGGCLHSSESVAIIQDLRIDTRGDMPWLYWVDRGLDQILRMPGDGSKPPSPVACAGGCGGGLDVGFSVMAEILDFVVDWSTSPAQAYFVKEAYPGHVARINLPAPDGGPTAYPDPLVIVCGSGVFNSLCKHPLKGDIFPFALSMVDAADGKKWLYYAALRGEDRGPPTVIYRQLLSGGADPGAPEIVVCSKPKYCKNALPDLLAPDHILVRQNSVSKAWELWWANSYTALPEMGVAAIFRSNLDGSNAAMVTSGPRMVPSTCQPCQPGSDAFCTAPASAIFCAQSCALGMNDATNCTQQKCKCSGMWPPCRPCVVGVDQNCTQGGAAKTFCQNECVEGRWYGGRCTSAVCTCEEGTK